MVVTNIYGGLGNQMFQYAIGKSMAVYKHEELFIDSSIFDNYELRNFQLDDFNVNYKPIKFGKLSIYKINNKYKLHILKKINKYLKITPKIFFEKDEFIFDDSVFDAKSFLFVGYWQSYKYFEKIRGVLLKEFTLKNRLDTVNLEILNRIITSNSVSIHIRRGDYVTDDVNSVSSLAYYDEAIDYVVKYIKKPVFYIFSDDIDWVKSNLNTKSQKLEYIDNNKQNPERDMELMKNCKNNIIANSTFSWWAAWLNDNNDKIVIAPKIWVHNKSTSKDLIPTSWIVL